MYGGERFVVSLGKRVHFTQLENMQYMERKKKSGDMDGLLSNST